MRECPDCGGEKPTSQSYCQACKRARNQAYYAINGAKMRKQVAEASKKRRRLRKDAIAAYKLERGCQRCGYKKCSAALDAHHQDGSKEFSLGHPNVRDKKWDDILAELHKCEILCSNCHRELHAGL